MKTANVKGNGKEYHMFYAYGYMDETHVVIRLYKHGEEQAYYHRKGNEITWNGHMYKSHMAKETVAKIYYELCNIMKAQ